MSKPELLAPAGDLEKLKIALLYGADAVYIGGTSFSLRARASNFNIDSISEGVDFAHRLGKKVYVTANMIPHNEDMAGLDNYLKELERIGVDAIIAASPYIIDRALTATKMPVHLSTQQSVTNSFLANHWHDYGIERVVLARELSIDEIKTVSENAKVELEVFIHGGMCVSYSGRCTLSNTMTDRDANRGGCAHSCRWHYTLSKNHQQIGHKNDFRMSSKDLDSVEYISDLISLGISSLKIEGRMKSAHYIATIVYVYRMMIDDYFNHSLKPLDYYREEIQKAENRETSHGFFAGITTTEQQLYNDDLKLPTQDFIAIGLDYDEVTKIATVEQRNNFKPYSTIEIISPNKLPEIIEIAEITDIDGNTLDTARHPLQKIKFYSPIPIQKYDMIRMCKSCKNH
ncbi:MAG: collagenase-like protease [Tenericutes bacterium HGW-Tenericutes-1]|jgi:putative protease|nr:MAG: collagenase-like protease [Tenericutes bacterium HGW-Tenericutes-1]